MTARRLLIVFTFGLMALILGLPMAVIFGEAFRQGGGAFLASFVDKDTVSALKLTLLVTAIVVFMNTLFGVLAAWLVVRRPVIGKSLLKTAISLPFSISPVVAGLLFVLWFGRTGFLGPLLDRFGIQILFAVPGVILGTLFVTLPLVFNELIPLMEAQGGQEELAAESLGANGFQTFFFVTIPNIKWALLYGVVLTAARSVGEFGAVSVLSGHIRGQTTTLTLQIEMLYNDYKPVAAFSCAALLSLVAVGTLIVKQFMERKTAH